MAHVLKPAGLEVALGAPLHRLAIPGTNMWSNSRKDASDDSDDSVSSTEMPWRIARARPAEQQRATDAAVRGCRNVPGCGGGGELQLTSRRPTAPAGQRVQTRDADGAGRRCAPAHGGG